MKAITPVLLLVSVGCSSTIYMRDSKPGGNPGPTDSKVVVYRSAVLGGANNFPIFEYVNNDGKLLGFTETGCYFEFRCDPGKHFFLTWGEGEAFVEATLEPGKIYYLQAWSKFGLISSRPGFAPVKKGSDDMKELEKIWTNLKCRELDPSKGVQFEEDEEARVEKAKAAFEAGKKAATQLLPEDGQASFPPQASK